MNVPENVSSETAQVLLDDLKAYQREQEDDPRNHLPPYHCGLIYAQLGDYASAVHSYQTALERNPEFGQAYFNMAIAYSNQELYEEAVQNYQQAIQYNPEDAEPWANLGALLQFQGKVEQARDAYRKSVTLNPNETEARRQMALMLYDDGREEEAEQVFLEAVEHNNRDAEAWNSLGLIAFRQDRLDEARGRYQKAVEIDENFAQAWNNLGNLHLKQKHEAAAVGAYRKALAGDSDDPAIWFNLGEFFFSRDHPEAEKCLARVVELDKSDMESWEMLRQWYKRHPHYPSWKSVLSVLLANSPEDSSLIREISYVHEKMGEHAEAISNLKRLIELHPEDLESRLMMAGLALKQGRPMDAFEQLSQLDSSDEEILNMWHYLGQRMVYHGNDQEAESCFMNVIAHRPEDWAAWQYLGELARNREQWELAFERFGRAEEINRNDRTVWMPLAGHFEQAGDYARAAQCLDRLSDLPRYMTGEWERFLSTYQQAGRSEQFLERLEQLLFDKRLPNRLWITLAGMYSRAGDGGRAGICLERLDEPLENYPEAQAIAEQVARETPHPPPAAPSEAAAPQPAPAPQGNGDSELEQELLQQMAHQPELPVEEEVQVAAEPLPPTRSGAPPPSAEERALLSELAKQQRIIAEDAEDFPAWFNAGNALFRLQRYAEAERHFRRATELQAEQPKAWYNLGCALEALGRAREACEEFEQAVALAPEFTQAWNWLGVLRFHLNQDDLARRAYLRCLACDRSSAKAWHNLGVLYHRLGEREKSAYCFREAKKLGGVQAAHELP
ncbi:MAG: tetratricopeptide repeat protein [SAR324 cluster bacterium]|nr:tetratricopeptide repeat protein [SAR324 cluster bacterium]